MPAVTSPVDNNDPVQQFDHVVDILNQVNRVLPLTAVGREELIALGGLLTQISGALLEVTDLLGAAAQHPDRTRVATRLLQDCRDSYVTAHTGARVFHADLKRGARARAHRGNGRPGERAGDKSERR